MDGMGIMCGKVRDNIVHCTPGELERTSLKSQFFCTHIHRQSYFIFSTEAGTKPVCATVAGWGVDQNMSKLCQTLNICPIYLLVHLSGQHVDFKIIVH